MEQALLNKGWEKVDANQYRHTDSGNLLLHDETGWHLQPISGKRQKMGRTLKEAIQKIVGQGIQHVERSIN